MDATERRARATAEAAQWWERLGTKAPAAVNEADREEFTRWLRESPLHLAELLHVAHVHDALERFKLWEEIPLDSQPDSNNVTALPSAPGVRKTSQARRFLIAASLCLVAIGAGWLVLHSGTRTFETERAERREVVLDDGSVLSLDPQTLLRVEFGRSQRYIALAHGRALFRAAKDSTRPFIVRAGDAQVRAIGTIFGVEQQDQGTIVTVSEGKVAVAQTGQLQAAAPLPKAADHLVGPTFLTANQQIMVRKSGDATPVREVDSSRALAWSQGRLVFDSTPLGDVAEQFNRYNRVQLRIDSPELARRTISGVFRASDPETLIDFISAGARVTIARKGDQEIVISPAP
jgi:transmembrane sensor